MMGGRVMFRVAISSVGLSLFPADEKLPLADSVSDPTESHVNSFGALLFDSVVCDTGCGAVVGLDRGRWLGMSEFFETGSKWARLFCIVEQGSQFCFGGA